jgi:alpha-tubulin suppressor-like RCC1 family protein
VGDHQQRTIQNAGDVQVGGAVEQIAVGNAHTCAVLVGGTVRCWGRGQYGRLGYGDELDVGDNEHPYEAGDVEVGGTVVQVECGNFHTCARLADGAVRCWGGGDWGKLGYGNTDAIGDNETPESAGDVPVF